MQTQVNEKLFVGQTIYTGIDTHLKNWNVTLFCNEMFLKQMSIDPSPRILSSYLNKNYPGATYKAVYEAGFSGFSACRELTSLGINCYVTHAADVPTTQKEKFQKTDTIDSKKLARGLMKGDLNLVHVPEVGLESDRALLRQRSRFSKDIARTKMRVKSLLFQFGYTIPNHFTVHQSRYWSAPFVTWLKDELKVEEPSLRTVINEYLEVGLFLRKRLLAINREVRALARSDKYKTTYELATSLPGFGCITGMNFLVQLGDVSRFKTLDELNYYIGLVPSMHGSGDRMTTGKLIKRGRKELKLMLVEASWIAVRTDPALTLAFTELSKRMPKNKAIIRIARKLLNRLRHVLMHKQTYQLGVTK